MTARFATVEAGEAYLSPDRRYRYALSRVWEDRGPMVAFIGLNPSTADEKALDPTLRRCIGFAQAWGYSGFWMGNLFAFRATSPLNMKQEPDPVGPENDRWLVDIAKWTTEVVCAWGSHGSWMGRDREVKRLLDGRRLRCLGVTAQGQPRHPLYLARSTMLEDFA